MREAELFEMLDTAGDAAFVVDGRGRIRFWNAAAERLLGLPANEALNRDCAAVFDALDSSGAHLCAPDCPILETAQRDLRIQAYDLEVKTAPAGRKWVNVSVIVARPQPFGEPLLIHLMRDIDARKRLENLTREMLVQIGRLNSEPAGAGAGDLTAQEIKVLRLLSLGHGTAAIGRELHISAVTVRNHIQHILQKLGAHSRLEAVMRAARQGLL